MPRDDERVTAVVPRPGQDEYTARSVRDHVACDLSGGESGALHQRQRMRGNDGARFDLADAGGAIYRERRSRCKTHFRENVACKRWHPLRFFIASGMCAGARMLSHAPTFTPRM